MNCKDCIHNEACEVVRKNGELDVYGCLTGGVSDGCPLFKNKADVEEVVRCKDCKFGDDTYIVPWVWCDYYEDGPLECDDFCSKGERRVGEECVTD